MTMTMTMLMAMMTMGTTMAMTMTKAVRLAEGMQLPTPTSRAGFMEAIHHPSTPRIYSVLGILIGFVLGRLALYRQNHLNHLAPVGHARCKVLLDAE